MHQSTDAPTPEASLLLHVVSRAASPYEPPGKANRREYQALVRYCADWEGFLKMAQRQKCNAAAWRFALDFDLKRLIPDTVTRDLKIAYTEAQARYLKKIAELGELTAALQAADIDPLIIKGVPLAQKFYTDPAVRISSDIDLLCREEDLDHAGHVLESLGYASYEKRLTQQDYRKHHYHFVYTRGDEKDSVVELHWNIRHPHKGKLIAMDSFWESAVSLDIGGGEYRTGDPGYAAIQVLNLNATMIRTPDAPHALWQLAVNLSYDMFLDLRGLGDLRRIARKLTEDQWIGLIDRAQAYDTTNEMSTALAVAEQAFGTFLPAEVGRQLRPRRMIRRRFLSRCTPENIARRRIPFKHTNTLVVQLLLRRGVHRKLAYLFRLVVPSRASEIETRSGKHPPAAFMDRVMWYANGFFVLAKVLGLLVISPRNRRPQWPDR